MPKKALYVAIILSIIFTAFSCHNRPKDVMSKREMRSFLYDLHVLEGAIASKGIIAEREKAYYYHNLFLKHGIHKEQFDSSIAYYTRDPKKFERIYLKVNKDIEELQADVADGKYLKYIPDSIRLKPDTLNIWYLDSCYLVVTDTMKQKLEFSIVNSALLTQDIYNFSYRMRVHLKDTTTMGYTTLRIHYADGVIDSLSHSVIKDSILKIYKFKFHAVRNYEIDSLTGIFYSQKEYTDTFNIGIDSVSLHRTFIPYYQDSLKLQLDTIPSIQESDSLDLEKDLPQQGMDTLQIQRIVNKTRY